MINFLLLFTSVAFAQENKPDVQVVMAKSGITLDQCKNLRDQLDLKENACNLLIAEYEPYVIRAKNIASIIKKQENDDVSVEKIARILKEFPETTDDEILKSLKKTINNKKE